ncbi:MAG: hypothetical protein HY700_11800 [Gemmatimonadetes bacterium]|nr:hypothetical protein [Gemmatimonadota bacterium]
MLTGALPFQADSAQETMIKRLTDEPMKLSEVMPGTNFPPRLQAVLDRALTRMPSERYASAAEFARDVVNAVAGMGGAAAVPIEEGATQLISAQDAKTAAVAAVAPTRVGGAGAAAGKTAVNTPPTPQPRPSVSTAAPRKKPVALVAAVVGVLVVGGGGAAVLMLNKGGGAPSETTPPVTSNTAQQAVPANDLTAKSTPAGATPRPANQTSGNQVAVRPTGGGNTPPATGNVANTPTVDSAAIDKELGELLEQVMDESTRSKARLRSQEIFDKAANPASQRAEAASYVAQAFLEDGNSSSACRWIGEALKLAPGKRSYTQIQQRLGCS